jgi:hypothetical protein
MLQTRFNAADTGLRYWVMNELSLKENKQLNLLGFALPSPAPSRHLLAQKL